MQQEYLWSKASLSHKEASSCWMGLPRTPHSTQQNLALWVENESQGNDKISKDISNNGSLMSYSPTFQGYFYLKNVECPEQNTGKFHYMWSKFPSNFINIWAFPQCLPQQDIRLPASRSPIQLFLGISGSKIHKLTHNPSPHGLSIAMFYPSSTSRMLISLWRIQSPRASQGHQPRGVLHYSCMWRRASFSEELSQPTHPHYINSPTLAYSIHYIVLWIYINRLHV